MVTCAAPGRSCITNTKGRGSTRVVVLVRFIEHRASFRSHTSPTEELHDQVEAGQNQRKDDQRGHEPEMQYHDLVTIAHALENPTVSGCAKFAAFFRGTAEKTFEAPRFMAGVRSYKSSEQVRTRRPCLEQAGQCNFSGGSVWFGGVAFRLRCFAQTTARMERAPPDRHAEHPLDSNHFARRRGTSGLLRD